MIAPAPGQVQVPGGLIHHWIGAGFLPDTDLDQALAVVRDYDSYQNYYKPSVLQSRSIARNGGHDTSWMVFLNKAYFMSSALDVDYNISNVCVDVHRGYRLATTTRVQEIERYGQSGTHLLPEGRGDGLAWKLHTITRLEQRDGGVYFELEAIELSRGTPAALRFIVAPIVRKVSRDVLYTSIQQTRDMVASRRNNPIPVADSCSRRH